MMRVHVAFLRYITGREEDDSGDEKEGIRTKLASLFSGPLIDDVQVIEFKDGTTYYTKVRFAGQAGEKNSFRFVVGFNGETKSKFVVAGRAGS